MCIHDAQGGEAIRWLSRQKRIIRAFKIEIRTFCLENGTEASSDTSLQDSDES